jgi:hypothetical protein
MRAVATSPLPGAASDERSFTENNFRRNAFLPMLLGTAALAAPTCSFTVALVVNSVLLRTNILLRNNDKYAHFKLTRVKQNLFRKLRREKKWSSYYMQNVKVEAS